MLLRITLIAGLVLVAGCATEMSTDAKKVTYSKFINPPEHCKEIGEVTLGRHFPFGEKNRENRFREMAAEMGGNFLRYDREDKEMFGSMHGTVFTCPATAFNQQ